MTDDQDSSGAARQATWSSFAAEDRLKGHPDRGAAMEFVTDQLGHLSTKTTWDIYLHLFRARD